MHAKTSAKKLGEDSKEARIGREAVEEIHDRIDAQKALDTGSLEEYCVLLDNYEDYECVDLQASLDKVKEYTASVRAANSVEALREENAALKAELERQISKK